MRISSFVLIAALALTPAAIAHGALPVPPHTSIDTTYPTPSGRDIFVGAGGDLQGALDTAQPGDVITLQAGAEFTGSFTLANKSGDAWILVRSSAEASLPPAGTRVSPAYRWAMAAIVGAEGPALQTAPGAHHFRFVGIELKPAAGTYTTGLVVLGASNATETWSLPSDIVFDRCYVPVRPTS